MEKEGNAFGQHSHLYQLVGVLSGSGSLYLLLGFGVDSAWLTVPLWFVFAFSVFLFIVPGHGFIYGPHLWLFAIADIFRAMFSIRRSRLSTNREENRK